MLARAVLAAAVPLLAAADEYDEGYPKYERQEEFSLPCGDRHTGRDTSDVTDWTRMTPGFSFVSGSMSDYTWARWEKPCPAGGRGEEGDKDGCQYVPVLAQSDQIRDQLQERNFEFPEKHAALYFLGLVMYVPWNVLQAVVGLIIAVFSLCCMCGLKKPKFVSSKKLEKMSEAAKAKLNDRNSKQVSPIVNHAADVMLGGFLAMTMFMAWSMEIMGNRSLNTAVHHAIHSVEGLTGYARDFVTVGESAMVVGDNVVKQLDIVERLIFGNADPVKLLAVSGCLGLIEASCTKPGAQSVTTPTASKPEMLPFFELVPGRKTGGKGDPRQSCELIGYTNGTDYLAVKAPLADICVVHCLIAVSNCTGVQWDAAGGGCVMWFGDKCSAKDTGKIKPNDKSMLYQRIAKFPTVDNAEFQCVKKTSDILKGINDNVLDLDSNKDMQYQGVTIRNLLGNMQYNNVSLCLMGNGTMATGLGKAMGAMAKALEPAKKALGSFKGMVINGTGDARVQLADVKQQIKVLTDGDSSLSNSKSVYMDTAGSAYPEEQTCKSLRCIDNTFDLLDSGEAIRADGSGGTGHGRTKIFTTLSLLATLGSGLGIAGLILDRTLFWKLTAFLFIIWGPASLLVCAPITPIFMFFSDTCQSIEDIGIQFATTSTAEYASGGGDIMLVKGSLVSEQLNKELGLNFTSKVDDIRIQSLESMLQYYLKGCQGGQSDIDKALDKLKIALGEIVEGIGKTASSTVDEMGSSLPAGMKLRQSVLNEVTAVVTTATNKDTGLTPVINSFISLIQCPRISQAYFELKAPICCDVMVAFYWVVWPLSMMGMCTCLPLTLGCCLGRKAFHNNPPSNMDGSRDVDVTQTSNPVDKNGDEDLG